MSVFDLKKYRILIILIGLAICFPIIIFSCNFVLRIIYPLHYEAIIEKYSEKYDLDILFVASVIRAESSFDVDAISPKDARGLMQIANITGRWAAEELDILNYNEEMLFNPDVNIRIGCWYLDKLRKEFDNNISNVLAAYNAGSGNVNKWLANEKYSPNGEDLIEIPFGETREYIKRVNRNYKMYTYLYR